MLTIHKASAGSGKTYALTQRYLKLLLGRQDTDGTWHLRPMAAYGSRTHKAHGEILAVTFTNKATQEMTERIIKELASLAGEEPDAVPSPYLEVFMREFRTDKRTIAEHAHMALVDLLFNFSWFNVSTIDAFFQRVLNTFTRELELSPTHGVEIDETYAISVAVGQMLQSINYSEDRHAVNEEESRHRRHMEQWLLQFMTANMQRGGSANLFSRSSGVHAGLLRDMCSFYNEQYKLHREEIDGYFSDFDRIVRFAAAISPSGYFSRRAAGLARVSAELSTSLGEAGSASLHKLLAKWASGDLVVKKDNKTVPKCAADPSSAFRKNENPSEAILDRVALLFNEVIEYNRDSAFASLLSSNIYQLGLFGQVNRYLDRYRHDNDSLLLSDTGDLLRSIISEQEAPYIYERMGSAIRHYLIDEFQDTSQMQWDNLRPLVLESLSQGNDNLIIGDEKQCIYRFRNSDPELLGSGVETMVNARFPGNVEVRGLDVRENTNWRSSVEIVEFNNTVFTALASTLDHTADRSIERTYRGLVQQVAQKHVDMPGYVCVRFLPSALVADDAPDVPPAGDGEADNSDDCMHKLQLDALTSEISRQLDAGYKPSDIAVLVRKSRQSKAVIEHLMEVMDNPESGWRHGRVPLVSSDSIPVGMSHAVRLIVNVLRLSAEPMKVMSDRASSDTHNDRKLMVNPEFQRNRLVHRFELERYSMITETGADGKPVSRRLTDSEALAKAVTATSAEPGQVGYDDIQMQIDAQIGRLSSLESPTLLNLTEQIIKVFLPEEARIHDTAFITAFQDLVVEFSENGNNSVLDFLNWWDVRGRFVNVEAPEELQGINVMTIHKAKGLEFECVHVPFFSDKIVAEDSIYRRSLGWYRIPPEAVPYIADSADIPPYMLLPNKLSNKDFPAIAAQVERWETEQTVDALNVAYVAFTRAVSELCVYVDNMPAVFPPSGRKPSAPRWGDYLYQALTTTSAGALAEMGIDDDKRRWMIPLSTCMVTQPSGEQMFVLGKPVVPEHLTDRGNGKSVARDATSDDAAEPCETECVEFADCYRVNGRARIFAEMDFDDISRFDFNDDRQRGMLLHSVLSSVRSLSDLPHALASCARRYRLDRAQLELCREVLQNALSDRRVAPWFQNPIRVIMERPVTGPETLRRPDRVVWQQNGEVAVIDYKFGRVNKPIYRDQVRDYCSLLADAGYPGAKGFLWFPLKGEIIRVV